MSIWNVTAMVGQARATIFIVTATERGSSEYISRIAGREAMV